MENEQNTEIDKPQSAIFLSYGLLAPFETNNNRIVRKSQIGLSRYFDASRDKNIMPKTPWVYAK